MDCDISLLSCKNTVDYLGCDRCPKIVALAISSFDRRCTSEECQVERLDKLGNVGR